MTLVTRLACLVLLVSAAAGANPHDWAQNPATRADADHQVQLYQQALNDPPTLTSWWQDFKATFGKPTGPEDASNFAAFKDNIQKVVAHNQDPTTTYFQTLNKFSDLTFARFSQQYLMNVAPAPPVTPVQTRRLAGFSRPLRRPLQTSSVDWTGRTTGTASFVSAVRDQGQCGSCWAFAATGAIESAYYISQRKDANSAQINLSEQQLVDCANSRAGYYSGGCNGGYSDWAIQYVSDQFQTTEAKYPYTARTGQCNKRVLNSVTYATEVKLGPSPVNYITSGNEDFLRSAVYGQPAVVYFDAQSSFQSYNGGVYKGGDCSTTGSYNHAMVVVGYSYDPATIGNPDDISNYWIVRNSWGTNWGEAGYVRVAMTGTTLTYGTYGMCSILRMPMTPTENFVRNLA